MIFDPREDTKSIVDYYPASYCSSVSFSEYLFNGSNGDLSAFAAIQLYMDAMPLFNAVSIRSEAFAHIPIRLWDKKKKEFVEEHPVLDLLEKPNADVSYIEFMKQLSSYYDITGNSFLIATGRSERPPLELLVSPPQQVSFGTGNMFGLLHVPDTIWITGNSTQFQFNAVEDKDKGIRFISSNNDNELWHIRSFNPLRSSSNFWGLSRARPVWLELQQYISGNVTNLSLLKRGTKLSLAWVNNRGEELTDKQWSRLQEEAQRYKGENNAGGTPILDGMDVKAIQQSNRDMEFKELQEAMFSRVSTLYRIPLALLLSQSMTLNNLETAMMQLFDWSVMPLTVELYGELTRFLLPRYPNSENLEFKFNESDIPAIRTRMIESAKQLKSINVNTTDEIRTVIGYEGLQSGGDTVLVPSMLIPLGEDAFTEDEVAKPTSKLYRLLSDSGYSEADIKEIIDGSQYNS